MARISSAKKKRLMFFGTLSLIIIGYFVFNLGYNLFQLYSMKREKKHLDSEYVELKREEKMLNAEIDKLKDLEYIAAYAREKFSYSKNGEKIIKIPELKNKEKQEKQEKQDEIIDINIDYNYFIYGGIGLLFIIFIYTITRK